MFCIPRLSNFVCASRKLKKEVHAEKKTLINNNIKKGSKEFWQEVNKLQEGDNNVIESIIVEGKEIKDMSRIADSFINFFTDKVNNLLGDYEPQSESLQGNIMFEGFSPKIIATCFDKLSNKKCGHGWLEWVFHKKVQRHFDTLHEGPL